MDWQNFDKKMNNFELIPFSEYSEEYEKSLDEHFTVKDKMKQVRQQYIEERDRVELEELDQ